MEDSTIGGAAMLVRDSPALFAEWVSPYRMVLERYAARLVPRSEVDDLVQETLLRAWRRWSTYRSDRGEPLPWLLAIERDRAARLRRRIRRRPPLEGIALVSTADPADVDLERALARLSTRQREAVDLYYFVDLAVDDVATAMGCAPGTVRATLHQARAALRNLLGDDDA